ncbi:hypothetical protein [Aeromicrobium chenweiae]|uniref:Uncharacterized protein n=1 Tax=Aeromicrobium chenweiae TaxID=2079793 RepID=A0A2S0WI84_9ACTN|nr:hypothetical protein [Aeromicrobium chenweiae]AWB91038.1 hypothetical protein C3E78_01710 [Aeromicrobium chenweiae]TGN31942.1 hypothetical protein E4L97_11220 [Aeromicrobium chenweiae]
MIKRSSRTPVPGKPDQHSLDGRLTNLGFGVFVAALALGVLISLWFQATTCFESCRTSRTTLAYVVTYSGFAAACVLAFGGARRAAGRGTMRAIWPAVGIVVVFVSIVIGIKIAESV